MFDLGFQIEYDRPGGQGVTSLHFYILFLREAYNTLKIALFNPMTFIMGNNAFSVGRVFERQYLVYDCAIIATDHSSYDYDAIVGASKLVIDTRNATRRFIKHREKIVLC